MKAIVIRQHGGPEVLKVEDIPMPEPQQNDVLVKNQAIGVNFVDTQHRAGVNYLVKLPLIPGTEAAGIVEANVKLYLVSSVIAIRDGNLFLYFLFVISDKKMHQSFSRFHSNLLGRTVISNRFPTSGKRWQ